MSDQTLTKIIPISLSVSTIYLVPCQGGYLQVDTGYDRDYPAYRRKLQKAGVDLKEIRFLFLTHHHDDHAGFLNDLARDGQLTIIANRNAKDLLLGGHNDRSRGGGWASPMVRLLVTTMMRLDPRWTLTFPPFKLRDADVLVDGDECALLRTIGIAGDILYTPGHCIDHQALLLDGGAVLCGDAASSFLTFAGTHYCTIFMTDMQTAYQSWQKLLDAGARTLYPSHGKPFPAVRLRENMGKIKTEDLLPL